MSDTIPRALFKINPLILTASFLDRYYYYPHFLDEETKVGEGVSFDLGTVSGGASQLPSS